MLKRRFVCQEAPTIPAPPPSPAPPNVLGYRLEDAGDECEPGAVPLRTVHDNGNSATYEECERRRRSSACRARPSWRA